LQNTRNLKTLICLRSKDFAYPMPKNLEHIHATTLINRGYELHCSTMFLICVPKWRSNSVLLIYNVDWFWMYVHWYPWYNIQCSWDLLCNQLIMVILTTRINILIKGNKGDINVIKSWTSNVFLIHELLLW